MVYSFVYFSSLVLRFCPFVAHPPPASSLLRRLSCPCAHLVQEGAAGGRKPNSFALDDFYAHHLIEFKNRPSPISLPFSPSTPWNGCGGVWELKERFASKWLSTAPADFLGESSFFGCVSARAAEQGEDAFHVQYWSEVQHYVPSSNRLSVLWCNCESFQPSEFLSFGAGGETFNGFFMWHPLGWTW